MSKQKAIQIARERENKIKDKKDMTWELLE